MHGAFSHSITSEEDTVCYFFLASPTYPGHHSCTFPRLGRSPEAAAELILAAPVELHQHKETGDKTTASPQLQNTRFPNQNALNCSLCQKTALKKGKDCRYLIYHLPLLAYGNPDKCSQESHLVPHHWKAAINSGLPNQEKSDTCQNKTSRTQSKNFHTKGKQQSPTLNHNMYCNVIIHPQDVVRQYFDSCLSAVLNNLIINLC